MAYFYVFEVKMFEHLPLDSAEIGLLVDSEDHVEILSCQSLKSQRHALESIYKLNHFPCNRVTVKRLNNVINEC